MSSARSQALAARLWYGGSPLARLLLPFAWLYGGVVHARRALYRRGWLRARHPGVPVIVVGNVTVGGTGKTPVVAWLAARLHSRGLAPGIVSRGYGRRGHGQPLRVTAETTAEEAGDEPLLLAQCAGVPVAVCADRYAAARALVADGVRVIIADDGLQHYALARDLEIVVVDGERRFGNERLLPAGPLREPVERIAEAGLVLVNGGTPLPGACGFRLQARVAVRLADEAERALEAFAGSRVWMVAGIGNPGRFRAELQRHGIEVDEVPVGDHGRADLAALSKSAARPILMTGKDAVKYRPCSEPDAWYVPVDVEMDAADESLILARVLAVAGGGR